MSCKRATLKQYLQDHESEPDTMCVNDVLQKCNVSSDKYYNALQNSSKTSTNITMHYKIHIKHQLSFYVVLPLKHA